MTFNDLFVKTAREEGLDEKTINLVITMPETANPNPVRACDVRFMGEWIRMKILFYKNVVVPNNGIGIHGDWPSVLPS